jgi:tetratricopeptide (TPR) repeat protein
LLVDQVRLEAREDRMKRTILAGAICVSIAANGLFGQQLAPLNPQNPAKEAQPTSFALLVSPGIEIPVGESSDYFSLGGSLDLTGTYTFTDKPAWFATAGLGYQLAPIQAEESAQLVSAGIGGGLSVDLMPRLSLTAAVMGGYFFGMLPTAGGLETGGNPYIKAGGGLSFLISPRINLGASVAYHNLFGFYNGVGVSLGSSIYFSGLKRREARLRSGLPTTPGLLPGAKTPGPDEGIKINTLDFVQVFPVFQTYYDDHPIGWAELSNQESEPVREVKVSLYVRQFMDTPKVCAEIPELGAEQEQEIELNALFNDSILSVTEGTKVAAEITLEYRMHGDLYQTTHSETMRLYDRNAITWDDDRKACAFVTAKDPAVLSFAKNVVGAIRGRTSVTVSENLLKAMALHQALNLYGISYVIDPQTPYAELSKNKDSVDFLQFPRQTLDYKAGDCDDLSILYSALLEAVGVETAFVTVPGHILMAFRVNMDPGKVKRSFLQPDEFIVIDDGVWIPVEVTDRGGFLRAWQSGAQQWRQHVSAGQAKFIAMHSAWEVYEPVALPGEERAAAPPSAERVVSAFQQELSRFINREIYPQVASLEKEITESGGNKALRNRLGVVYARYGLLDEAERVFRQTVSSGEFVPALVNLGNIYYMREQWEQALDFYQRAYRKAPSAPDVLLAVARAHYQLEHYGVARSTYTRLKESDPKLAERYAYLDQGGEARVRAADVARTEGLVEWSDE